MACMLLWNMLIIIVIHVYLGLFFINAHRITFPNVFETNIVIIKLYFTFVGHGSTASDSIGCCFPHLGHFLTPFFWCAQYNPASDGAPGTTNLTRPCPPSARRLHRCQGTVRRMPLKDSSIPSDHGPSPTQLDLLTSDPTSWPRWRMQCR